MDEEMGMEFSGVWRLLGRRAWMVWALAECAFCGILLGGA